MTVASVPLGDVGEFVRGVTFKPADVIPEGVPVMATKAVQKTLVTTGASRIPAGLIKRSEQFLREGDTLVSTANSWNLVGKCCWVPQLREPSAIGGFVAALRPRHGVEPRYLYHWFSSPAIQATVRSFGAQTTNIANLNLARCREMPIPLPPIEEQRRIADILDRADALRAKRREALILLDDLKQSIFLEMFGDPSMLTKWPVASVGELTMVKGGMRLPKGSSYSPIRTPFRYIRVTDLRRGEIDERSLQYLTSDVQKQISRYTVAEGDVVITIAGTIGAVAPVSASVAGANLTENAAKLVPQVSGRYTAGYLSAALRSESAQAQIGQQTGQVTIGKLALFRIEKISIPLPPVERQRNFDSRIRLVDQVRQKCVQASGATDAMFFSLQHRAFAGEI